MLREIEDVVDEGQQMPSGLQDVLQVLRLLVIDITEHLLREDFREPDDGIQRRPEFVAHVGEKLGLVAAGGFELPALVRDLPEEAGVLGWPGGAGGGGLPDGPPPRAENAP